MAGTKSGIAAAGRRDGPAAAGRPPDMIRAIYGSWTAMVSYIIVLIVVGLIAGAVARLLVPGRDPMGVLGTVLLGIAGSLAGGFVWDLIEYDRFAPHKFHPAGIIGSILGAIGVLILLRLTGAERRRRRL